MVYLNISVKNLQESIKFYADSIGIFHYEADRLTCKYGVELILDLVQVGTESHSQKFDKSEHVKSSFWISINDKVSDVFILNHLKENNVQYEEVTNLGGHYLNFIDPSGNKFTIHAHHGVIK